MGGHPRKTVQDVFIRVCRDSGFRLEATRAAHLAAKMLGISAFEVWTAMDLDVMRRIASGEHPAARKETPA